MTSNQFESSLTTLGVAIPKFINAALQKIAADEEHGPVLVESLHTLAEKRRGVFVLTSSIKAAEEAINQDEATIGTLKLKIKELKDERDDTEYEPHDPASPLTIAIREHWARIHELRTRQEQRRSEIVELGATLVSAKSEFFLAERAYEEVSRNKLSALSLVAKTFADSHLWT
jgi:chromosome segregation ATPase